MCRNLALNRVFLHYRQACWVVSIQHRGASICPSTSDAPVHPYTPCTSVHPHTPCTSVCSFCSICSQYAMGTCRNLYIPCLWSFGGASVHQSGISVSVSTSICLSVHKSYQMLPIIVGCFLLDWILWMSAMLNAVVPFFSVFIMSQVPWL